MCFSAAAPTITAIRHAKVPILLAHGEDDGLVPVAMSREMARAAEEAGVTCHLKTFPGAEHCMSFIVSYEEYTSWRNQLLRKYINGFDNI